MCERKTWFDHYIFDNPFVLFCLRWVELPLFPPYFHQNIVRKIFGWKMMFYKWFTNQLKQHNYTYTTKRINPPLVCGLWMSVCVLSERKRGRGRWRGREKERKRKWEKERERERIRAYKVRTCESVKLSCIYFQKWSNLYVCWLQNCSYNKIIIFEFIYYSMFVLKRGFL